MAYKVPASHNDLMEKGKQYNLGDVGSNPAILLKGRQWQCLELWKA